jgi:hypothetical protein
VWESLVVNLGYRPSSLFGEQFLSAPIHPPPLWSPNRSFISTVTGVRRRLTSLCAMVAALTPSLNPWLSLPSSQLRIDPNPVAFGDRELKNEHHRRAATVRRRLRRARCRPIARGCHPPLDLAWTAQINP